MGDRAVEFRIQLIVCIKEIQRHAADVYSPYIGVNVVIHIRHINYQRFSVFVELTYDRQRIEVLCVIICNLLSVHAQRLLEVSVSVEEANTTHVDVAVGSLFHIVTGKHSQTARVDFQYLVDTEFHAEICN